MITVGGSKRHDGVRFGSVGHAVQCSLTGDRMHAQPTEPAGLTKPLTDESGEIFVFWSLLKIFFTKRHMPKRLLKIDHFLGVLEHDAKV